MRGEVRIHDAQLACAVIRIIAVTMHRERSRPVLLLPLLCILLMNTLNSRTLISLRIFTWYMSYMNLQAHHNGSQQASRQTFHARRVARSYNHIEALTREALCSRLPNALPCAPQSWLQATPAYSAGSHLMLLLNAALQIE